MKKRTLRLLSIAIIMLLAIPQNTLASMINTTAILDTKETTIYYSEKNGERQTFTKNSQGAIIPGSIYNTQNTTFTSLINNGNQISKQRKSVLKNQFLQQGDIAQIINSPSNSTEALNLITKDNSSNNENKKFKNTTSDIPNGLLVKFKDSTLETMKNQILSNLKLKSTSMATPHVTGIAALLLGKQPTQYPLITKQNIMKNVTPLPLTSSNIVTGGLVDPSKALSLSDIPVDNNIPGVDLKETNNGTLDQNIDLDDVYSVNLNAGQTIIFNLNGVPDERTDFDLHLYSSTSTTLDNLTGILASSEQSGTSNETITFTATKSDTYYVDVSAYAGAGSYTLRKSSELIYDDTSSFLKYTGSWVTATNASNEGRTAKSLNNTGNVSFSFTGSSVKWTGFKDATQGIGSVIIDGVTQGKVNLYAANRSYKQVLFEKSLNFGLHTMEIHWAGIPNKNGKAKKNDPAINIDTIKINASAPKANAPIITSSTGHASNISLTFKNNDESADQFYIYKSIDGSNFTLISTYNSSDSKDQEFWFEDKDVLNNVIYNYYVTAANTIGESAPSNTVTNSKITTNSVYTLEDTNPNINYIGNWDTESISTYSGGSRHVTVEAGSKVSLPFTAFESRIKLMSGPNMGIARIYWSNASGDYYDANLNTPINDYWTFGTSSRMQTSGNWVIECVSGKIAFDVEEMWNYSTVAPKQPKNLKGVLENSVISLVWDISTELDLKGYNVYRKATVDSDYSLLNQAPIDSAQFTDTSVLPNQLYTYVVKAVNYANLESDASTEAAITHVITAPTGLVATLSNTSAVLNWVKHIDPVVTKYNVYRSTTLGSDYQLLDIISNPTLTYTDPTVVAGTTYYYVISAVSNTGTQSVNSAEITVVVPIPVPVVVPAPVPSNGETTTIIEEDNANIVYLGNWGIDSYSAYSSGKSKYTTTFGSSLSFNFTGTGIKLSTASFHNKGIANIILDGTPYNVDMYSPFLKANNTVFQKTDLVQGTHSIKVEFTGTKNTAATSNMVLVDSFKIINGTISAVSANGSIPTNLDTVKHIEEYSSSIVYLGNWGTDSHSAYSGGKAKYTTTSGSSLSFSFTGTGIKLLTASFTNKGIARVTLDGTNYNVDMYTSSLKPNNIVFQKIDLIKGTHSIKVEFTATKNTAATSTIILVDAFDIINGDINAIGGVPTTEEIVNHIEENNTNIAYLGSWNIDSHYAYSAGKAKYTTTSGSSISFTFTGTGVKLLTASFTNKGIATVTLDGIPYNVDMYAPSLKANNIVFQKTDLALGSHSIKVEFTGIKNATATSNIILLDSFEIINGNILATGVVPIIEPTVSHFEEYNSNIAYVGSWGIDSHSAYSEGKSNYTTTSGSSLSFSFTGTAIKLLTASSTNKGIATVTLDGVSYNVDMYSSYLKPKNIVFQKTDLILGTHTIKVEFTGTKNTAATSSIILVDSFEIINGDINSP